MVPLHLLNSNDPRHDMNQPSLITNVTPILNLSRIFSMRVKLCTGYIKIKIIKKLCEQIIELFVLYI